MKVGDLIRVERPVGGFVLGPGHLAGQLGIITGEGVSPLGRQGARVLLTNGKEFWFEASELEVMNESR
tara:strand:+ start:4924 stop:5127 length:204 start_codon:yes stop_codon:yes gene_type:complete